MSQPGHIYYVLSNIFGYGAVICFALLYTPQVILNYQLKSTEGFSLALSLIWHVGATFTFAAYIYDQAEFPLIAQFGVFLLFSVLLLSQFFYYFDADDTSSSNEKAFQTTRTRALTDDQLTTLKETRDRYKRGEKYLDLKSLKQTQSTYEQFKRHKVARTLIGVFLSIALTSLLVYLCLVLFEQYPNWGPLVFGSIVASVFFALGFLPQLYLFSIQKHSNGFSLVLSVLDISGCTSGLLSQLFFHYATQTAPEEYGPLGEVQVSHLIPLITIIIFQIITLFFALFLYPPTTSADKKRMKDYVIKGIGACCMKLQYHICIPCLTRDTSIERIEQQRKEEENGVQIQMTILRAKSDLEKKEIWKGKVENEAIPQTTGKSTDQIKIIVESDLILETSLSAVTTSMHDMDVDQGELSGGGEVSKFEIMQKVSKDYFEKKENSGKDCLEIDIYEKQNISNNTEI